MEATQNVRYCCGSVRHYKRADNLLGAAPNALTVVSRFTTIRPRLSCAAPDANHVSDLGQGIGSSALQSAEPPIIGTNCHGFVL
jgi:hypothetical protein